MAHVGLIIFGLVRMRTRRASIGKTGYRYTPRTTYTIGKLLKRRNLD
jgi:hypothetical protein